MDGWHGTDREEILTTEFQITQNKLKHFHSVHKLCVFIEFHYINIVQQIISLINKSLSPGGCHSNACNCNLIYNFK